MKTIAVHSHKGGAGKTTIALLLAKFATQKGTDVCLLDFDFIGSGIADLLAFKKLPAKRVERFFLDAEPEGFDLDLLIGAYTDPDMDPGEMGLILNVAEKPGKIDDDDVARLRNGMTGLIANEPHYREIITKTQVLLERLKERKTGLVVIDCHPGLGFVSKVVRQLADLNIYVTTPNRSDCFGLLKIVNRRRELDVPSSFLLLNMAGKELFDLSSFTAVMQQNDPLVGEYAKTLFSFLKVVGKRPDRFAVIPKTDLFVKPFYIGPVTHLPRIEPDTDPFRFCQQIISLIT